MDRRTEDAIPRRRPVRLLTLGPFHFVLLGAGVLLVLLLIAFTSFPMYQKGAVSLPVTTLQQSIGRQVALEGIFSLQGKEGPFIVVENEPVYVITTTSRTFEWGEPYSSWEGKRVRVTGVLRFAPAPALSSDREVPVQIPPPHYYFVVEQSRLELAADR